MNGEDLFVPGELGTYDIYRSIAIYAVVVVVVRDECVVECSSCLLLVDKWRNCHLVGNTTG